MIFVNFKTYPNGTGEKAVELAKICKMASAAVPVIPVVQFADIYRIKQAIDGQFAIWGQHTDAVGPGQHTGWVLPESLRSAGASGVFINHSEHKISPAELLVTTIRRAKEAGLTTLVFAGDMPELSRILPLQPSFVAYEPPELVGSRTVSVASRPEVIAEAANMTKEAGIPLIVGAGIHSPQDVRTSLVAGAVGVAVARDILEATDPTAEIHRLLEGFSNWGVEWIKQG
jgi:triosephosphate isomerase